MSVPNLFQQSQPNFAPPPPPPPPPPPSQVPNLLLKNKNNQYGFQSSPSSDTLVQDDPPSNGTLTGIDAQYQLQNESVYEPPNDYDLEDEDLSNNLHNHNQNNGNTTLNSSSLNNSMCNRSILVTGSSPLTPRQIKQRNTAKRNSIATNYSDFSLNQSITSNYSTNNSNGFTAAQLRDLAFLQTQKFDSDFIRTTNELFVRYPNAKISISVIKASQKNDTQQQVTQQVEIDRNMFDKICAFHDHQQQHQKNFVKSQLPQTPPRTSSVQQQQLISTPNKTNQSHVEQIKEKFYQNFPVDSVKSELERAIENRMRRQSLIVSTQQQQQQQQITPNTIYDQNNNYNNSSNQQTVKKINSNLNSDLTVMQNASSFPPPPSPKELHRLARITEHNNTAINNSICNETSTISSISSPPPPPPLPDSFDNLKITSSNSDNNNNSQQLEAKVNVKSIVNNFQQKVQHNNNLMNVSNDPRMSSDFSALIAKKAAEKRAKFMENKPMNSVANAVTYQSDGSKVYANSTSTIIAQSRVIYNNNDALTTNQVSTTVNEAAKNNG